VYEFINEPRDERNDSLFAPNYFLGTNPALGLQILAKRFCNGTIVIGLQRAQKIKNKLSKSKVLKDFRAKTNHSGPRKFRPSVHLLNRTQYERE